MVLAVCARAASVPSAFEIERTISVGAPPSALFPLLNSLKAWRAWSPWEPLEADIERHYEGPDAGVGATYRWSGSHQVGAGSLRISGSMPDQQVALDLDIERPQTSHSTLTFTLAPDTVGTRLSWSMKGSRGFLGKLSSIFVSMETAVGASLEKGLENLKAQAETPTP